MSLFVFVIALAMFFVGVIVGAVGISVFSGAKLIDLHEEVGELRHQLNDRDDGKKTT